MSIKAQRVSWRERRAEGSWGGTVYYGLLMDLDGRQVLVSDLSHGMRVFAKRAPSDYQFYGDPVEIKVSQTFVEEVRTIFLADIRFQIQKPEFERAMSEIVWGS